MLLGAGYGLALGIQHMVTQPGETKQNPYVSGHRVGSGPFGVGGRRLALYPWSLKLPRVGGLQQVQTLVQAPNSKILSKKMEQVGSMENTNKQPGWTREHCPDAR